MWPASSLKASRPRPRSPIPPGGDQPAFAADGGWNASARGCNGYLLSFAGADPGCSGTNADADVKAMARKVGTVGGDATPDDNHALGARTDSEVAPGDAELYIQEPVPLPGAIDHFLVAGIDAAALHCGLGATLLSFTLTDWTHFPSNPVYALSPSRRTCARRGPTSATACAAAGSTPTHRCSATSTRS